MPGNNSFRTYTDYGYIRPMNSPEMSDDPNQIASDLIEQYGADGALDTVREGIATAHTNGDNYRLSVWREVRRVLREKQRDADNQQTPAA